MSDSGLLQFLEMHVFGSAGVLLALMVALAKVEE